MDVVKEKLDSLKSHDVASELCVIASASEAISSKTQCVIASASEAISSKTQHVIASVSEAIFNKNNHCMRLPRSFHSLAMTVNRKAGAAC